MYVVPIPSERLLPDKACAILGIDPLCVRCPGTTALATPTGKVWVKTLEPSRRRFYRLLLAGLGRALPFPILRPSKAGKGGDTLLRQAEQIDRFARAGLPVPRVHFADRDFLVMSDEGITLEQPVKSVRAREASELNDGDLHKALMEISAVLAQVHGAGLVHGRPKIRDFAWRDKRATLLDLEERPAEVMPLATAQARDVFLWLADLGTWPLSREVAQQAAQVLEHSMGDETLIEVRKLCRLLSIIAGPAKLLQRVIPGNREIKGALAAQSVMRVVFAAKSGASR